MAFRFSGLLNKLDANKLSLFVAIEDAFDNVKVDVVIDDDGCNIDANCSRDCRSIDFDDDPNCESSLILANGLFLK